MRDMTQGKALPVIVSFALPMIVSGMLQQCYNIADSVIAGQFAGVDALAAVGVSNPITGLFVSLGTGAGMGASVVISQLFGAKQMKQMKTSVYTAILSIFVMSLVLMLVGAGFSSALTRLMNTPDNIYEDALAYLQIYMWGLPFLFLYNIANAVFNALGESKKPLYFLIFSTILNIGLDLLFVAKFHWGVAGVAWATFIAQGLAAVLAVSVLLLKIRKIPEKGRIFDGGLLGGMSRVGIPTMFQMAVVSIGNLFVQALVNSYGSDFIVGYSAALKINGFFTVVITTLGSAVATFTAQNIGAEKMDRPGQGLRAGMSINFIYVALAVILVFTLGEELIGLFVDDSASAQVYDTGVSYLRVVVCSSFFFIILNNTCAVSRGAGYMIAFTSTTLVDLVVRVVTAYALSGVLGSASVYWSVGIGWLVGAVMGVAFYKSGKWKQVQLLKKG